MIDHAEYILKAFSSLQNLSPDQILQIGRSQAKNGIPLPSFDENLLINLCQDAKKILESEDTILKIDGDSIIVGDIHGSLHDLLRIINYVISIPFKIIFLGDYVDRGQFSLECIILLLALKIMNPEKYFLLRGNHEFDSMCSVYGFKKEILDYHNPKKKYDIDSDQSNNSPITDEERIQNEGIDIEKQQDISTEQLCDNYFANHINMNCYKYTEKLYDSFMKTFSFLPIASIINKTTLCIHGGLCSLFDKIEKIEKLIQRPINDFDENPLLCGILWGDPTEEDDQLFNDNQRGRGQTFNGATVVNFLKNNNLKRIIRAHECVFDGVLELFNDKCITIFSASSYSPDLNNKSGILKLFKKDDKFEKVVFQPLNRLQKCDAIYYKVQAFNFKRFLLPKKLKSISNFGIFDLNKKETDKSKLTISTINRKRNPINTRIHSRNIKQCYSAPLNFTSLNKSDLFAYETKNDSNIEQSNNRLPTLVQNDL